MMVSQHDPSKSIVDCNEIYCLTESEKNGFVDVVSIIEKYCEGHDFTNDEQKLRHAASKLPEPFSKGTKYAVNRYMEVVKPNTDEG